MSKAFSITLVSCLSDRTFHLSDYSPCWFAVLTDVWNFAAYTIFLSHCFGHLPAQLYIIFLVLLYGIKLSYLFQF